MKIINDIMHYKSYQSHTNANESISQASTHLHLSISLFDRRNGRGREIGTPTKRSAS